MKTYDATMIVEGAWELTELPEEPDEETYLEAAQLLIDTGLAWQLQGVFGRTCQRLIEAGLCLEACTRREMKC
jgi:hypothetical protein